MASNSNASNFSSIAITGASKGIGAALALELADNNVTLFLSARDMIKLENVAKLCREKGAQVYVSSLDVRDMNACEKWIMQSNKIADLNLVIANAGISGGTGTGDAKQGVMSGEEFSQIKGIFDVNLHGVLNTIQPAIAAMAGNNDQPEAITKTLSSDTVKENALSEVTENNAKIETDKNRRKHIAIMSSMAGFRGMPGAPAYCASKAAVKSYGEGLRGQLALNGSGIEVSVICPGFVKSDMTDANGFKMPFLMSAERAARIITRGLKKKKGRISFPFPMILGTWFMSLLPNEIVHKLTLKSPSKPAANIDDIEGKKNA